MSANGANSPDPYSQLSSMQNLLPNGQREKNLARLSKLLTSKDMQEVRALLAAGPPDWRRIYLPCAEASVLLEQVLVQSVDGLLVVLAMPRSK